MGSDEYDRNVDQVFSTSERSSLMKCIRLSQNSQPQCLFCCMLLLLLLVTSLTGCNPEEAIQQYFAEKGLNPLAILRTDVEPGTLILVGKTGEARLVDQLTSFLPTDTRSPAHLPIQNCGTEEGCLGILSGYQENRTTTASAAVSFFHSLFLVQPALDLELSEQLSIEQLDSRYKKIGIGDLEVFLRTLAAKPVYRRIRDSLNDAEQAFVA
ncbi:MAG: hypothetical protein NPIRA05_17710 [Nitrospirales bacterium]|nr:MAG: hypothetical protein NPIRA05_17710 [Nitrospirales bacterium]